MTNTDRAATIRNRADRAIAHLRAHAGLLRGHGLAAHSDIALLARLANKAIADGRSAYDFAVVYGIADTIARTSDRVLATAAFGPLTRDDAGLATIAANLRAIDSDRPDADLLPV